MSDGEQADDGFGGEENEEGRSALDQWLVDAGYSDEQLAEMSNDEKLFALGWDSDDLSAALAEDGFTPEQIAAMSNDERAAAVWNTIAEHETLERFGYTEDEIDAMTPKERTSALSDMEDLRAAGYDPASMSEDERRDALERLHDDDVDNDGPDDPQVDEQDDDPFRPDREAPGPAWNPDDEDIDPFEEDPDDPEDDELLEDEEAADAAERELQAEDDAAFDELYEPVAPDVMIGEGAEGDTPTAPADGAPRPWDEVTETTSDEKWFGPDGAGARRGSTTVAEDDEYGTAVEVTETAVVADSKGVGYASSFDSVVVDAAGNESTIERETNVDVGAAGVDLGRTVRERDDFIDGSSAERSSTTAIDLGLDGLDTSFSNTNVRTDADGTWEGSVREFDAVVNDGGVSIGDSIDSRADGGPLGDRSLERDVDFELHLGGVDLSDRGAVTVGDQSVGGEIDILLGPDGADLGLDLNIDLGLDPDLGIPALPIDAPELPTDIAFQPMPLPTFVVVEPMEYSTLDLGGGDSFVGDVVDDVVDVVTDVVDELPPPPPPPPPPDEVADAVNDWFD